MDTQSELKITTGSYQEFMDVCTRINRGEIRCRSITVGKTNGQWVFNVYPMPQLEMNLCAGIRSHTQPSDQTPPE